MTIVTDHHWEPSSPRAEVGSGKRRAEARIPEQTPRRPFGHPAHARAQVTAEAQDQATPLYTQLAAKWAARGATVPCLPDPLWQRLTSIEHLERETETTLRQLHLAGIAQPTEGPLGTDQPWTLP